MHLFIFGGLVSSLWIG